MCERERRRHRENAWVCMCVCVCTLLCLKEIKRDRLAQRDFENIITVSFPVE